MPLGLYKNDKILQYQPKNYTKDSKSSTSKSSKSKNRRTNFCTKSAGKHVFYDFCQGPRKLKKSVGAKTQKFLKNDPLNSNFCFLLHFYTTIFKSQWVQMHPLHPLLRGPWIMINDEVNG